MKEIEVFTDGACRGNPGVGGWGVLFIIDGEETILYGGEENTTNNRMELTAAIKSLQNISNAHAPDRLIITHLGGDWTHISLIGHIVLLICR